MDKLKGLPRTTFAKDSLSMNNNHLKNKEINIAKVPQRESGAGFTLLEIVIVLAVFVFVILAAMGIFTSAIERQKALLKDQELFNQVNASMEYMARTIQAAAYDTSGSCLGSNYDYSLTHQNTQSGFYQGIKFYSLYDNLCHEFFLDADGIFKSSSQGTVSNVLAPSETNKFTINYVRFIIDGDKAIVLDSSAFHLQPRITVVFSIITPPELGGGEKLLQTTISRRNLNEMITMTSPISIHTLSAIYLNNSVDDKVRLTSLTPNGIKDNHISVSGLRSGPIGISRVSINSNVGNYWGSPPGSQPYVIATSYDLQGNGNFWFEPAAQYPGISFHVKVFYKDGTTDEADAYPSNSPPPQSGTPVATFFGITEDDKVGRHSEGSNGEFDDHIHVSNLRGDPIERIVISPFNHVANNDDINIWMLNEDVCVSEGPNTCGIIHTEFDGAGNGDFWFENHSGGWPIFIIEIYYSVENLDYVSLLDAVDLPPPPPFSHALIATYLGRTGEDKVSSLSELPSCGSGSNFSTCIDNHISVSGLRSEPASVVITSDSGNRWETPPNGSTSIIADDYIGGKGDFFFEPAFSEGLGTKFHVLVTYGDQTTDEADASNQRSVPVTVPGAKFISQDAPPPSMAPGETRSVSITMKNSGTGTWPMTSDYYLYSQHPSQNVTWGKSRINLPSSVLPGENVTFTFDVKAPPLEGDYDFQWSMGKNSVGLFGEYTTNVVVTVSENP